VLLRITEGRARKIAGPFLPPAGSERRIQWRPSRDDRRAHPELPVDAVVRGRLIAANIPGEDGKTLKLYLSTSLEDPREALVELYRRRWDIELDIRSLNLNPAVRSLPAQTRPLFASDPTAPQITFRVTSALFINSCGYR
jgi:hypothetical protein